MKTTHLAPYKRLLARLIKARKALSYSQAALARSLGKVQTYVSKAEIGERRLDIVEFVLWAKTLGLDPAEQIGALASAIDLPKVAKPRKRARSAVKASGSSPR